MVQRPNRIAQISQVYGKDFVPMNSRFIPINCWPMPSFMNTGRRGEFHPYTTEQLIDLIADIKTTIPRYCRVNRVIRDIPSNNVVEGNCRTSLRQDVHDEMQRRGTHCECIRCRESEASRLIRHCSSWMI